MPPLETSWGRSNNTQHNASLVEETASAAHSLNQQAQLLTHAVGVFKLDAAPTLSAPRLQAVPRGPAVSITPEQRSQPTRPLLRA